MHALIEPWQHGFMQRALLELVLIGVLAGVLGCWIVFYELSYSTESLAHALFPGLVAAALFGLPLLGGATGGLALAAVAIATAGTIPTIGRDTAVAIVITTLFGVGVLLALAPASPPGIQGVLFGDPLAVSTTDLIVTGTISALSLGALLALYRPLLVVGFDPGSARALGVRPLPVELALIALVAAAILVAVQALGNLLVVAILIGPAATSRLVTRRLRPMMVVAGAIAIGGSVGGLYLSYYGGLAAGASIAAVLVGAFLVTRSARAIQTHSNSRLDPSSGEVQSGGAGLFRPGGPEDDGCGVEEAPPSCASNAAAADE